MEIGAVGVAIAIFNQASKVTIFPLVSITTSFVAEEDTIKRISDQQIKDDLEKGSSAAKNNETKAIVVLPENKEISDKIKPESERRNIPSASTALVLGVVLGLLQTIFLVFLAKPLLSLMGVKSVSIFLFLLLFIDVYVCYNTNISIIERVFCK